ncbi:MAG: hypothetical protein N2V78_07085 [Methanophagales archaeon]|nr:hypothetical protein [Methanophagales archaeon]
MKEPTGTMDPITRNCVADAIKSARANLGMTFLIVSHGNRDKTFGGR